MNKHQWERGISKRLEEQWKGAGSEELGEEAVRREVQTLKLLAKEAGVTAKTPCHFRRRVIF